MIFYIKSDELRKMLVTAVKKELSGTSEIRELISIEVLVDEAMAQVKQLRDEVIQYDTHHRASDLKPCKNHRLIADRIVKNLCARMKLCCVYRTYAYKVMFIMYLICHLLPPKRKSWWENKFLEELPDYLDKTEYFKETNSRYRLNVLLDELNVDRRLPLDISVLAQTPKPNYPFPEPLQLQVFLNCPIDRMENDKCLQYYA